MKRCLSILALSAGLAFTWAVPAGAVTRASGTSIEESLAYGTGLMVNAGYFFKDTMFYSHGRGGLHVDVGRAFPLAGKFGLWIGAGAGRASGTLRSIGPDSSRYDTQFDAEFVHADIGILTPITPFPVGVMLYRHKTSLNDQALDGPLANREFMGASSGLGWGITIHVLFEWFPWKGGAVSRRGPGLVLGYMGLVDMSKTDITVKDGMGGELLHKGWKPVAGESLRAGIEWEY